MSDADPASFPARGLASPAEPQGGSVWQVAALWLALAIAMSPVLSDMLHHWGQDAWSRYSLVFVALLALAVLGGPRVATHRALGGILMALAVLTQLIAVLSAVIFMARPFLAVALIGMLLFQGRAPLRTALLALWIVPIPSIIMSELGGPAVAAHLFNAAAVLLAPLGIEVEVLERAAVVGPTEARIALASNLGGLSTFAYLTGLVWYRSVRGALSPIRTVQLLISAALVSLPVQLLIIVFYVVVVSFDISAPLAIASVEGTAWILLGAAVMAPLRAIAGPTGGTPKIRRNDRRSQ